MQPSESQNAVELKAALEHIEAVTTHRTLNHSRFEARRLASAADDIRLVLERRYNVTEEDL